MVVFSKIYAGENVKLVSADFYDPGIYPLIKKQTHGCNIDFCQSSKSDSNVSYMRCTTGKART